MFIRTRKEFLVLGWQDPSSNIARTVTNILVLKMTMRYFLVLFFATSLMARTPPTRRATPSKTKRPPAKLKVRRPAAKLQMQMQPTPQRITEIQAALKANGYDPGNNWEETQEVCRKIADEHRWQTDHAPDVRVLILLGLGGPHSDLSVAQMNGSRLDKDQRVEAMRQSRTFARR